MNVTATTHRGGSAHATEFIRIQVSDYFPKGQKLSEMIRARSGDLAAEEFLPMALLAHLGPLYPW